MRALTALTFSTPLAAQAAQAKTFCAIPAQAATATATASPLLDVTVYQYQICPFCTKVKTFLDFVHVPYSTIEVNPVSKKEIKVSVSLYVYKYPEPLRTPSHPHSHCRDIALPPLPPPLLLIQGLETYKQGHTKVPVVMVDGQETVESNAIVFMLHDLIAGKKDPATSARLQGLLTEDTAQWAEWSEARLAVMLYPNITRNFHESWEAFDYCKDVESWTVVDRYTNRVLGPVAMYFANGKVKKKHGIVHEREELAAVCSEWTTAVSKTANAGPFLHGAKVTMPDLMVFGVLKAIAGLPTFSDIMTRDRQLMAWYVAVSDAIAGN